MYNIERFIEAQDKVYVNVIEELKNGRKRSHWMWFVFPQFAALGYSDTSLFYGIKCVDEARAYMENDTLKKRYLECCNILLKLESSDILNILGEIDSMKLKSSLTLFRAVDKCNEKLYDDLLNKFYNDEKCSLTEQLLNLK